MFDKYFYESVSGREILSQCAVSTGLCSKVGKRFDNIIVNKDLFDVTDQIIGYQYSEVKKVVNNNKITYEKNEYILFDPVMNIFYTDSVYNYSFHNSDIREQMMSVRIAKFNLSVDTDNKYYQKELEREELELNKIRSLKIKSLNK